MELFLNGKSFGVKGYAFPRLGMEKRYGNYPAAAMTLHTTADLHLSWDVLYEPGTLRVVGMKDGKEIASTEIATTEIASTGVPLLVKLSSDRNRMVADRRDVAHIVTELVDDANGTRTFRGGEKPTMRRVCGPNRKLTFIC